MDNSSRVMGVAGHKHSQIAIATMGTTIEVGMVDAKVEEAGRDASHSNST